MAAFSVRLASSTARGGDTLREGGAPPAPAPAVETHVMPLYVIVEEGRTQANVGKPEEE